MRIAAIETYSTRHVAVVKARAEDGLAGWGQTAPYNADITAEVLHRQIAPHVLGKEAADPAALIENAIEENYKFPWSYVCRAAAGVETALWDLAGRREGKGVVELLSGREGGSPRAIAAYGSSMRRDIRPADEAGRLMRLMDERGFRAFKVRVGRKCGHDRDEWPGRTEELVETVRRRLGDGVTLLADGNSCYSPARAIEVGRLLEAHGFRHFEEPCPYWELEWTAEVAAALDIPVAGGEQDNDLAQWRRMVAMRAVDIVQPDVCYVGGISRAARVAATAAGAGLPCTPHCANTSLIQVFTMHLMAAAPNAGPFMEWSVEPAPWTAGLFEPALEVKDGAVAFPEGPGWGVEVSERFLSSAERRASGA